MISLMDIRMRLAEIERELDDTSPTGPYRARRQKLNRERRRLWRRMEGLDPMWAATRREGCTCPNDNEREHYLIKVQVVSILEELNAKRKIQHSHRSPGRERK